MRFRCYGCGKSVSSEVPDDAILRAVAWCPECCEAGKDQDPEILAELAEAQKCRGAFHRELRDLQHEVAQACQASGTMLTDLQYTGRAEIGRDYVAGWRHAARLLGEQIRKLKEGRGRGMAEIQRFNWDGDPDQKWGELMCYADHEAALAAARREVKERCALLVQEMEVYEGSAAEGADGYDFGKYIYAENVLHNAVAAIRALG
jgi:hypothetical protein